MGISWGRFFAIAKMDVAFATLCAPPRSKHFQSPRRPFSRPKGTIFTAQVPSAALSGKRASARKSEGQENGYGRYCNHNLRRALPRTPRDVAVLLSAGYLTVTASRSSRLSYVRGINVAGLPGALPRQRASQKQAAFPPPTGSRRSTDILTFPLLPGSDTNRRHLSRVVSRRPILKLRLPMRSSPR